MLHRIVLNKVNSETLQVNLNSIQAIKNPASSQKRDRNRNGVLPVLIPGTYETEEGKE